MESLSDLLKYVPGNKYQKAVEQKSQQILADPLIKKLKVKYPDITDEDLQSNMNRLYQYLTEYNHCMNCPGLERCPNDLSGHYTMLSSNRLNDIVHIYDSKVVCKKLSAKQSQDAIRSRIRSFYVDERALNEGYSSDEMTRIDRDRAHAVERIMDYIVHTKEHGLKSEGLYLVGDFGTGKTFLMCYLLYELAKVELSGVIVYMPDFIEDLKAMFQEPQQMKEMIDLMKETDLLVFDDIGAENVNPWVRDHVLGSILNYRMNRKPTFFTSNYTLDALEQHFSFTNKDGEEEYKGRRMMERIQPFVEVIEVNGANKRKRPARSAN